MPALNSWEKDAFYPCLGSRKLCGSADRPGRSRSPLPASPPLTLSQSNLLINNNTSIFLPVALSPSPEQKQEAVKGVGRDAEDSNGSSAQDCWHMILILLLPLGLYPTLTSIPHLSPGSPPSLSLRVSAVPVSVSRTFAFSRGDSLAGSPGNRAWLWPGASACDRLFPAPVHSAPAPSSLHAGQHPRHSWATPHWLVAHWGQQSCHSLPSMMQIPGRMGWGQGEAIGLGSLWCALPVISCT